MNASDLWPVFSDLIRAVLCVEAKLNIPPDRCAYGDWLFDFEREPLPALTRLAAHLQTLAAKL